MTPEQQRIADKIRTLADEAWDTGEKDLSTQLHELSRDYEQGNLKQRVTMNHDKLIETGLLEASRKFINVIQAIVED